jgi:3-methyladenine DNA glycosylase/8-oxoguanine DNA glycosylase
VIVRRFPAPPELDLPRTLGPLRHGPADPTIRIGEREAWHASRTPDGAATLHLRALGPIVEASAWGPGAAWAIGHAPGLVGIDDDPAALLPRHPLVLELARRFRGTRLMATGRLVESLLPAICEQKITGAEAWRVYRRIVLAFGEPAPPAPGAPAGLTVSPRPHVLASLPYHAFHPLGLERRRADVLKAIGERAAALEACLELAPAAALARLQSLPGIGPWTAAEAVRVAFGDPDALSLGDYHLPALVCWSLAGESRGGENRMLELLAPYAGQRARVVRLLELSGRRPARRGPRLAPRSIGAL